MTELDLAALDARDAPTVIAAAVSENGERVATSGMS
jgi:hypothetical protein